MRPPRRVHIHFLILYTSLEQCILRERQAERMDRKKAIQKIITETRPARTAWHILIFKNNTTIFSRPLRYARGSRTII